MTSPSLLSTMIDDLPPSVFNLDSAGSLVATWVKMNSETLVKEYQSTPYKKMKISLIVAMASNRVIGLNNKMPWHLSADLKKFKKITLGSAVLMGRKTHESIGKPLPGRTNIVISRNLGYRQDGCLVVNDIETALKKGCENDAGEIFVIGGSDLYEAILPIANAIYLTIINKEFEGDTFFPDIDLNDWSEVEREDINDDPDADFNYSFLKLEKVTRHTTSKN